MRPNYNYTSKNKLSEIMGDPKIQPDKFGAWSSKHLSVRHDGENYAVDYAYLHMLKEKFGDIHFGEAVEAYHASK